MTGRDRITGKDKILHLIGGVGVTATVYYITGSIVIAAIIGLAAGPIVELVQSMGYGTVSVWDVYWTIVGVVIAVLVILILRHLRRD